VSSSALSGLSGDDRNNVIVNMLQSKTKAMQAPVIESLMAMGVQEDQITSFWVANKFAVKGMDLGPLKALSGVPGLFTVREPYYAKVFPMGEPREVRQAEGEVQWGVAKINAPAVWKSGNKGKGVVVGIIDTGVNVNHVALSGSYKNDEFSWADGFGEHDTPYDGNGHGTHCAGTIAGTVNGIGVAPEAKWIACRGLNDEGSGDETSLTKCGEFMACPGKDANGNCTGLPNVVSNSWGGAVGGQTWFNKIVTAWRNLGIIPVFALGNSGPMCGSAGSPGDQPNLISVGSTDKDDKLSYFSSRGFSRTFKIKPEVAAPGRDIVSASNKNNTGYATLSGTSMATPHVAGAVALILSAHPQYKFQDVSDALTKTAVQPRLGLLDAIRVCYAPRYPNNGYGSGRIDVSKAVAFGSTEEGEEKE